MQIAISSITTVAIVALSGSIAASEPLDDKEDHSDAANRMVDECLSGDRKLECLKERGFSCASVGEPSRNSYSCYVSLEGGCYRNRFQLTGNGWNSADQWQNGECEDTYEPVLPAGVRMRFDNINAPDFVRLKLLLSSIFSEMIHFDEHGRVQHYLAPGASAKTDYEQISTYLASKYIEIETEIHEKQVSLLCDDEQPSFRDSRLRETFDEFDDLSLRTYAEHLAMLRKDFEGDDSFDLEAALVGYPGSFSLVIGKTEGSIDELYQAAVRFCTRPFEMTFRRHERDE